MSNRLNDFVQRVVALEEQIVETRVEIRGVLDEAHQEKFDKQAIRQIVREKRMNRKRLANHRRVQETVEQYRAALGMLAGTPLGEAATKSTFMKEVADEFVKRGFEHEGGNRYQYKVPDETPG